MYRKLEKPYAYYSTHYDEFYTHFGDERFLAWTTIDGFTTSKTTMAKGWPKSSYEYIFEKEGGAVVAPSPIILWEK